MIQFDPDIASLAISGGTSKYCIIWAWYSQIFIDAKLRWYYIGVWLRVCTSSNWIQVRHRCWQGIFDSKHPGKCIQHIVTCKWRPTRCNYFGLFMYSQSALHVSGNVFAHHQEYLTVFTASDIVHRYSCRLVSWMRWNCCSISTMTPAGSNIGGQYPKP